MPIDHSAPHGVRRVERVAEGGVELGVSVQGDVVEVGAGKKKVENNSEGE